jgi:hypothetical protein
MRNKIAMAAAGMALAAAFAFAQTAERRAAWSARPVEGGFMYEISGAEYGPYGSIDMRPWMSPDASKWAFSFQRKDGSHAVLVNGGEVAVLPGFRDCGNIILSPDGKDWALRGTDPNGKQSMVFSGKAYGPFDRVSDAEFLPGGHWRCRAETGKGRILLLDGRQYGPYSGGFMGIAFDRSGQPGFDFGKDDGTSWFWYGGRENGPYAEVQALTDPAGYLMGYSGRTKAGKLELVAYGKKYGPYDYYLVDRLSASPDGKDWMILVTKAGKQYLLQNGKETAYNRCAAYRISNGTLFTYEEGMSEYIVYNGKKLGPYETVRDFMLSGDGATWACGYVVYSKVPGKPDLRHVLVNGTDYEGTALARAEDSSGEHFSWVSGGMSGPAAYNRSRGDPAARTLFGLKAAPDGSVSIVSGSGVLGPYESIASQPWTSADGAHWGILAAAGGGMVVPVIDGSERARLGPYDKAYDFSIGPSGADYGFIALKAGNRPDAQTRVVDGREYGPFTGPGRLWFGAKPGSWHLEAQAGGKDGGSYHYLSGKPYGPFAANPSWAVSDLGKGLLAMSFRKKDGQYLFRNGALDGPYQDIEPLYGGYRGAGYPEGEAAYLGAIATRADGGTLILLADGTKLGPYRVDARDRRVWASPDGSRYFIGMRKVSGGCVIVADGKELSCDGYDMSPLARGYELSRFEGKYAYYGSESAALGPYTQWNRALLSADRAHWAVETGMDDGKSWRPVIVIDGREAPGDCLRYGRDAAGEYFSWIELDAGNGGWLNVARM